MSAEIGYVYFLRDTSTGYIKIGYSMSPARRLSQLQTGHAAELHIVATIINTMAGERSMHARFAAHHVRGEWFRPHREIFEFIAARIMGLVTPEARPAEKPVDDRVCMTPGELSEAARRARENLRSMMAESEARAAAKGIRR